MRKQHLLVTMSLCLVLVLALGACGTSKPTSAPAEPPPEPVTLRIDAKCGPTPYAMPFFVMMAQTGGQLDDVVLEYVPVTGPSQMVALFTNNQVDVMVGQVSPGR
jgi:ABC-type nitrate/sulfonate/bicarbonate transport system substrate-binding protein